MLIYPDKHHYKNYKYKNFYNVHYNNNVFEIKKKNMKYEIIVNANNKNTDYFNVHSTILVNYYNNFNEFDIVVF